MGPHCKLVVSDSQLVKVTRQISPYTWTLSGHPYNSYPCKDALWGSEVVLIS